MKKNNRLLAIVFCFVLALGALPMLAFAEETGNGGLMAAMPVLQAADDEQPEDRGAAADWEVADFTYGDYEKTLYGCDYSREFVMSGKVVTGFSEAGEAKLAESTDLVIPAVDDEGNTIIGVDTGAFKEKGLTSVQFPQTPLIDYDDVATHGHITKRGNFIIAENAFAGNSLTEVMLPLGVLAVLPNAFQDNQITRVDLPRTIWWIETLSFANNQIEYVNFPQTCDFQLEIHGMAFADNNIKAVRLPDFTEVVNMHAFVFNPGMEAIPAEAPDKFKTYGSGESAKECGVVYMYADADLTDKGRIHHIDRTTSNTKSWTQRLIVNNSPESEAFTPYDQADIAQYGWVAADFTFDGSVVTGLSESGLAKRADGKHRDLVIPERTSTGINVTEIAAAGPTAGGLFATADEAFDTVYIPSYVTKIGENAFRAYGKANDSGVIKGGLTSVTFSPVLQEIGASAFMTNNLSSVSLPNTVTTVGSGAFATNPDLSYIGLSTSMTEVAVSAFGCSDNKNYMTGLTELTIPVGITKIGQRAFAGNNIQDIVIPDGVTEIGEYAFSTKNYLNGSCTLTLPEGLMTIGDRAFRNKVISSVVLPTTVTKLPTKVFEKEYSDGTEGVNTLVLVSNEAQINDPTNFPASDHHTLYYTETTDWTAADFTYGEWSSADLSLHPATDSSDELAVIVNAVTGFSEMGEAKLKVNTDLVIPATDTNGNLVCAVANSAFQKKGLTSVTLPAGVKVANDKTSWNADVAERGNFFIGASAFLGNALTDITIPEGVLYIGVNAFNNNKLVHVSLPSTLMLVGNAAFGKNEIASVEFPETTDFPLQLSLQAFAINKIKSVQVPTDISFMNKWVFLQNTGMEPITTGTAAEKKGGLVYVYVTDISKLGANVAYKSNEANASNVQEIVEGAVPAVDAPWGVEDFTFDDAGTTVTGLTDAGKAKLKVNSNLVIPDQNDGKDIVGIGAGANGQQGTFGYSEITTVDEQEITAVYAPTSVVLPANLEVIGDFAFQNNQLMSVSFQNSLVSIGSMAFQNTALTSVVLPDSVTTVGAAAFSVSVKDKATITSAKLSKNMKDIPQSMFAMQSIKDIVIPEGVETIGRMAFTGNYSETVSIPGTVTKIDNQAFTNNQFKAVEIPASVISIGQSAFRVYGEGLEKKLESLSLHEGLQSIAKQAFDGSALVSVNLPTTVTTVNADAFKDSVNTVELVSIVADQANATGAYTKVVTTGSGHQVVLNAEVGGGWYARDFLYSEDGTKLLGLSAAGKARAKTNHELVLPGAAPGAADDVVITTIAEGAFMGDETAIGKTGYVAEDAFVSVTLPSGLTTIEKDAFAYNALTEMKFAECPNITAIGETAFKGNQLRTVELPDTVTELGSGAFSANNISSLKLSSGVTAIPQGAFSMNINLRSIEIPDTVTEIGESAFAGARLESLEIPASVVKIDKAAFKLHRISNLIIPGTVKELGESAFEGTYKDQTLTTLTLEEGIEAIGRYAFKEGLLTEVKMPSSVTSIGDEPFLNNVGENGNEVVKVVTDNPAQLQFGQGQKSYRIVCTNEQAQQAFDEQEATNATAVINELPAEPTLDDAAVVAAAREAYEDLTESQKELVSEDALAKLEAAEAAIASAQAVADVAAAIEALPEEPALEDDAAVTAVQTAFEALTDEEKAKLPEGAADKLAAAVAVVASAKAVANVAAAINALPEEPTLDDAEAVAAARAAFDALTGEEKAKLPEDAAGKLEAAEAAVAAAKDIADQEAANSVADVINALSAEPTLDDAEAVAAARAAFDALTEEQKAKLPEGAADKLVAAEKAIAAAKAAADKAKADKAEADRVKALIEAAKSGTDPAAVAAARAAYDALTADQKALVSAETLKVLTDAEEAVKAAEAAKAKKANTMTANGKAVKLKAKTLKSKKVVIKKSKAYTVKNPVGAVQYTKVKVITKVKGNMKKIAKKFVVNKTTGKITVKKGVKKGLYKLRVKIVAQGDSSHEAASKTVTVKIRVK